MLSTMHITNTKPVADIAFWAGVRNGQEGTPTIEEGS